MPGRVKIFFDGGLRPAGMETAVVVRGKAHVRLALGPGTSSDAEWLALIHALEIARGLDAAEVLVLGDSASVVRQATGVERCRGVAEAHGERVAALMPERGLRIRHIRRTQNLAGIALTRLHPR